MGRYRLDFVQSLARQMAFVPATVRDQQLAAAETLLLSIDPAKAYPPPYVVFRITGYRAPLPPAEQATGLALQHDLGLLIEHVSITLDQKTADRAEPVLQIGDVAARFDVTSKTIQRWRRRGLAARRFVFPDGKRRVGFRLSVVEQFIAGHSPGGTGVALATESGDSWAVVRRHVTRLAADPRRPVDDVCGRVARRLGRSALAVQAEVAKHDAEHPADALLTGRTPAVAPAVRARVLRLSGERVGLSEIARLTDLPRSAVYRVVLSDRLARSVERRIKFFDDPLYHQPDAERQLLDMLAQEPITDRDDDAPVERTAGLSSELRALCVHPVLRPTQERALFLMLHFRKYQAAVARRRLDPAKAGMRQIHRQDRLLAEIAAVRNRIVRANLRLVVSVARKHVRPTITLPELVSEGTLTLLRAVESFDTRRGNKFSTYATLALMKGFARSVGRSRSGPVSFGLNAVTETAIDRGRSGTERVDNVDRIDRLMSTLDAGERQAVRQHFGLDSVTPESSGRLRRVHSDAISKLRTQAGTDTDLG